MPPNPARSSSETENATPLDLNSASAESDVSLLNDLGEDDTRANNKASQAHRQARHDGPPPGRPYRHGFA